VALKNKLGTVSYTAAIDEFSTLEVGWGTSDDANTRLKMYGSSPSNMMPIGRADLRSNSGHRREVGI
jgi:hypothetical protein